MDRYRNRNCPQRETCFSPRAQRERKLVLERARRIMELPLDYVPNPQFEAWSRDKQTENEVLGPMPARRGPRDADSSGQVPRPPACRLTWPASTKCRC